MENKSFPEYDSHYYNVGKSRIVSLIPEGEHVVFDIGCATGRVGKALKEQNKAACVVGAEIFRPAAKEAEKNYDKVHHGDIEEMELDYSEYFDYVICGDILEHLQDPYKLIGEIRTWLKTNGRLIVSVPNVRYYCIIKDLVLFGKWEYRKAGVLDRTHLRFFTRSSCLKMLTDAGFLVEHCEMVLYGSKKHGFNALTLGILKEFLAKQILVVARKQKRT